MSWPEAFVLVGGMWAIAAMLIAGPVKVRCVFTTLNGDADVFRLTPTGFTTTR